MDIKQSTEQSYCEIINVLGNFILVVKPSGNLSGNLQERAVKGCPPAFEGSSFGNMLGYLGEGIKITKSSKKYDVKILNEHDFETNYKRQIKKIKKKKILSDDDYDRIKDSWWWVEKDEVVIWTGNLIKTKKPYVCRMAKYSNRPIKFILIQEQYLCNYDSFKPLLLRFKFDKGCNQVIIKNEIASIMPLNFNVPVQQKKLSDYKNIGIAVTKFYNAKYFKVRAERTTFHYKKLIHEKGSSGRESKPQLDIFDMGLVDLDFVNYKHHTFPENSSISYVDVLWPCSSKIFNLGSDLEFRSKELDSYNNATLKKFKKTYPKLNVAKKFAYGVLELVNPADHVYFQTFPPFFIKSSPNLSCIFEAVSTYGDGLRGIIWTDKYFVPTFVTGNISPNNNESFKITKNQIMGRIFPISRDLQNLTIKFISFNEQKKSLRTSACPHFNLSQMREQAK